MLGGQDLVNQSINLLSKYIMAIEPANWPIANGVIALYRTKEGLRT